MIQQIEAQAFLPRTLRWAAAAVCLVATAALIADFFGSLSRYPDRTILDQLWRDGRYFTKLTILLIVITFARVAATGAARSAQMAAIGLWIAIVAIVYHTLLSRDLTGLHWWTDHGLHSLVPVVVIVWWLAYAPKDGLRPGHAVWWLIWPGLYMAYALIRGEIDGLHPYFFLDPPLIGWPKVILWCLGLGVVFWLAGLALIWAVARFTSGLRRPADGALGDPRPR